MAWAKAREDMLEFPVSEIWRYFWWFYLNGIYKRRSFLDPKPLVLRWRNVHSTTNYLAIASWLI
jgi:hypothetical protein